MLTIFNKIFTWWNQDTFGTRIKTIFYLENLLVKTNFGNKYYESKKGKRWVIYNGEVDASKIPVEWYSWIHFTPNKIEKDHNLKNINGKNLIKQILTGTEEAYFPNKNKNANKKKYKTWKS